jgi:hypothetical protein
VPSGAALFSGCPRLCVHLLVQFYSPHRPLFGDERLDFFALVFELLRGEMSDLEIAEEKAASAQERGCQVRALLLQDFEERRQAALERLRALWSALR